MEVVIKDCADNSYVIEVGVDDTTETMRQKVASAVGLAEDSFHMGFGGKDEGDDITQLSAGDTIILTKSKRCIVSPISDRGACIENGPPPDEK